MKKFLSLAVILLGVGASQTNAKAGISIGISIGDSHRHRPPVIVHRPPVVIPCPPPVVIVDRCDSHGHYYRSHVRHCDYRPAPHYYRSHRDDHRSHGYGYRRDDRYEGRGRR